MSPVERAQADPGRFNLRAVLPYELRIDASLKAGRPFRQIASAYGVSKTALHRHWHTHLSVPGIRASGPKTQPGRKTGIVKWVVILGLGLLLWGWIRISVQAGSAS